MPSFRRDRRGVTAVETALIMLPFCTLLIAIIQTGVYFSMQSALDASVLSAAESLRSGMTAGASYTPPTAAALKSSIATGGGVVLATATLAVDVRQMATLSGTATPVADGSTDWGGSGSILVLRAQAPVSWMVAGAGTLTIQSMAVVRRTDY